MSRSLILGAASSLAILISQTALAAGPTIVGGGSSLVANDVGNNGIAAVTTGEFALDTSATFIYQKSGSGAGRNAVLQNNELCNVDNIGFGSGATPAACPQTNPPTTLPNAPVAFGNSDAVLTANELAYANTSGKTDGSIVNTTYGDLVQLPFLGTGIAIPEHEASGTISSTTGIQTTATIKLNDNDLCGIFSGLLTNWNQTSAASVLGNNAINVVVRSDSSGSSFLFTNHLAGVCTSTNSAVTFTAQSTFANEFPGATLPANFTSAKGSSGIQAAILATAYSVSYISPDYTHMVAANQSATVPFVASVAPLSTAVSKGLLPSTTNISKALAAVDPSNPNNTSYTAPTGTAIANPTLWIPIVQTVTAGYPIVGYTNIVVPQCFDKADATTGVDLVSFLVAHFKTASYLAVQKANGFVGLPATVAGNKFKAAVLADLLTRSNIYSIASTKGCVGFSGRGVGTN